MYDAFRSYGVTHLLWPTGFSSNGDSVAGDLVFFDFALRYGREARAVGGFTLARMPDECDRPPRPQRPLRPQKLHRLSGIYRDVDTRREGNGALSTGGECSQGG